MPIEVTCGGCQRRLRVPDKAAGKRIKCPKCEAAIAVPADALISDRAEESGGSSVSGSSVKTVAPKPLATIAAQPSASAASKPSPAASSLPDQWFLKTEDGEDYGPVSKAELDHWVSDGRVTADCQVLQEGADQWQWANDVYPELSPAPEPPAADPPATAPPPPRQTAPAIVVRPAVPRKAAGASAIGPVVKTSPTAASSAPAGPVIVVPSGGKPAIQTGGGKSFVGKRKGVRRRGKSGKKSIPVTLVAVFDFVFGAMYLGCGGMYLLAGGGLAVASAGFAASEEMGEAGDAIGMPLGTLATLILLMGIVSFVNAIILIIGGIGVITRSSWGRVLSLIGAGVAALYVVLNLVMFAMANGQNLSAIVGMFLHGAFAGYVFFVLLGRSASEEFG